MCTCTCMYICTCIHVSVHASWCTCRCQKIISPSTLSDTWSFVVHRCGCQASWPTSFQGFSRFTSHLAVGVLGLQMCGSTLKFYLVYGDSNSGRHTHAASTLPTKPSPKNLDYYKQNELRVNLETWGFPPVSLSHVLGSRVCTTMPSSLSL